MNPDQDVHAVHGAKGGNPLKNSMKIHQKTGKAKAPPKPSKQPLGQHVN